MKTKQTGDFILSDYISPAYIDGVKIQDGKGRLRGKTIEFQDIDLPVTQPRGTKSNATTIAQRVYKSYAENDKNSNWWEQSHFKQDYL